MSKVPINKDGLLEHLLKEFDRRLRQLERTSTKVSLAAVVRQNAELALTNTAYAALAAAESGFGNLPNFKALWDSGLRPEFMLTANLVNNTPAAVTRLSYSVTQYNDGEAATALLAAADENSVFVTGTSALWTQSAWFAPSMSDPTKSHGLVQLEGRVSAGTGTFAGGVVRTRWVLE